MVIKDKDGNIYKLRGPNPQMKQQDFWDKKKLKLINMDFKEETIKDDGKVTIKEVLKTQEPVQKESTENVLSLKEAPQVEAKPLPESNIKEVLPEPKIITENPKPIEKPVSKETIIEEPPKSNQSRTSGEEPGIYDSDQLQLIQDNKVNIYCLPVYEREVKDEMYGDSYTIPTYGLKFSFEGVITEEQDLFCNFWTNTKIPQKSIVYPRNQSRRWWQVQTIEPLDGGYLVSTALTNVNPDFTD